MLTLHHLNNSGSQRILWMLEELDVPYEIKLYEREMGMAPAALKAIHPLGKAPILTDGPIVIAESGAIVDYVLERHGAGRMKPQASTDAYVAYIQWCHYAEGSAMRWVSFRLITTLLGDGASGARAMVDMLLAPHLDYIDNALKGRSFLVGDTLTGADILMSFPLETADSLNALHDCPAIRAYLDRLHKRPAYQRALQIGGPFDLRVNG